MFSVIQYMGGDVELVTDMSTFLCRKHQHKSAAECDWKRCVTLATGAPLTDTDQYAEMEQARTGVD